MSMNWPARRMASVHLNTIERRKKKPRRQGPRWFCVWGVVAVQIEERVKGLITLEDRLVLVRAQDEDDAERKLEREWSMYAKPYLNPDGYLVRWQLVNVRDVYELSKAQSTLVEPKSSRGCARPGFDRSIAGGRTETRSPGDRREQRRRIGRQSRS